MYFNAPASTYNRPAVVGVVGAAETFDNSKCRAPIAT